MRAYVRDQPGLRQLIDVRVEQLVRELSRLLLLEPALMPAQVGILVRTEGEQVAGCAHGGGGAVGDPSEDGVEVGIGDQVGGGRVEAVEALGHRAEPGLEHGDVLRGVRHLRRGVGVPGDLVHAGVRASRLTGGFRHPRRREAEQDRRLAQQPLRPLTVRQGPGEPINLFLPDHRAARRHLERLEHRHGGELAPGLGYLSVDRLRRAERAHQRGHRGPGVLREGLLADLAGDLLGRRSAPRPPQTGPSPRRMRSSWSGRRGRRGSASSPTARAAPSIPPRRGAAAHGERGRLTACRRSGGPLAPEPPGQGRAFDIYRQTRARSQVLRPGFTEGPRPNSVLAAAFASSLASVSGTSTPATS